VNIGVLTVCAVIGALMPDLDATDSKIKHLKMAGSKTFVPPSTAAHREFGHRGLLHSLRGWKIWTVALLPLALWIDWLAVAALSLGYASHLASDACTKTGIPAFYPRQCKVHLLPKRLRVTTGSEIEESIFALVSMLSVMLLLAQMRL